jgi:hypothetical protein
MGTKRRRIFRLPISLERVISRGPSAVMVESVKSGALVPMGIMVFLSMGWFDGLWSQKTAKNKGSLSGPLEKG